MEKDILQVLHVAFLCIQPHASLRPPMSEVVALLTCKFESYEAPLRPAFLERKQRNNERPSWETLSEVFPSPSRSDSASFLQRAIPALPSSHPMPVSPLPQLSGSASFPKPAVQTAKLTDYAISPVSI